MDDWRQLRPQHCPSCARPINDGRHYVVKLGSDCYLSCREEAIIDGETAGTFKILDRIERWPELVRERAIEAAGGAEAFIAALRKLVDEFGPIAAMHWTEDRISTR